MIEGGMGGRAAGEDGEGGKGVAVGGLTWI